MSSLVASGARAPRPSGATPDLDALLGLRANAHLLDLRSGRRAPDPLSGTRPSRYRARGMEYAESRAYQPGDEIRNMDWRVTARTGRPHTKLFQEERERPVMLAIDFGPSMFFGTRVAFKSVVAAHAAALVAWAALRRGDHVGAVILAPEREVEIRAAGGRRGVLRVLRALHAHAALPDAPGSGGPGRLAELLSRTRRISRTGSLVVLASDFYGFDEDAETALSLLRSRCELVGAQVVDPLERQAPPPGRYAVSDGHAIAVLDSSGRDFRERYRQSFEMRAKRVRGAFARLHASLLTLETDAPVEEALHAAIRPATFERPVSPLRAFSPRESGGRA